VDAFALHNAFEANYPEAMTGVVALANVGHEVTNLNVLDDGVPMLTREIHVGTRRVREDLQRLRGLSAMEAEAMLRGHDRSPHLDSVLSARAEELSVGIERAVAFLASSSRNAGPLRAVYLCGGGAACPASPPPSARR
jgi:type IV pilus assembly protein PilM